MLSGWLRRICVRREGREGSTQFLGTFGRFSGEPRFGNREFARRGGVAADRARGVRMNRPRRESHLASESLEKLREPLGDGERLLVARGHCTRFGRVLPNYASKWVAFDLLKRGSGRPDPLAVVSITRLRFDLAASRRFTSGRAAVVAPTSAEEPLMKAGNGPNRSVANKSPKNAKARATVCDIHNSTRPWPPSASPPALPRGP